MTNTSAEDTRDVLKAALEAAGLSVVDSQTGQWTAPVAMIDAGNPWIERYGVGAGAGQIHWRIVGITGTAQDASNIAHDLLTVMLTTIGVLTHLQGWKFGDVTGIRPSGEAGEYRAAELTATTTIDITEGI
jgi:hypothetical protein